MAAMRFDRHLWLALLLAAAVLLPRAILIAGAHSECYDDEYHLFRGARFLQKNLAGLAQSDPPLGEGLSALPLALTNSRPGWSGGLYDHSLRPESLLLMVALWRSLLFLPVLMVAFAWCRRLYGVRAAWPVLAILLVEPTFAAHIPLAALDALGMGGIVVACYLAWRFFDAPSRGRLVAAACAVPFALLLKQTAIILPLVVLGYAVLFWGLQPWLDREPAAAWRAALPARLRMLAGGLLIGMAALWALLLFDVSRPDIPPDWIESSALKQTLDRPLPAGLYLGSILRSNWHAARGHPSYLFGESSMTGWWYYFPAVMSCKVPIGIGMLLLLGLLSLRRSPPRFAEWSLFLPLVAWTALMLATRINIGMRHFLPAYVFMLMLAGRSLRDERKGVAIAAWGALLVAALHAASFHPNYLSYVNWPRDRVYLSISDSNLDWGQSLKQVRDWIDRRPQTGRPVHLLYFGDPNSPMRIRYYLRDRVIPIDRQGPLPRGGLLIASPVWVAGPFDPAGRYAALRTLTPVDVIGDSMLVYDLDRAAGRRTGS
jgi:hypothetical protein